MIGKMVKVIVDRPLGSYHLQHKDIYYPINYGYIPGILAPDGEEQDAYILGIQEPVQEFTGKVIAIIHRLDDVEDKWVVAPEGISFTKEEIMSQVTFQEQYFQTEILMHSVREATLEDIPRLTHIMVQSFRTAFAEFVSQETMDAYTNEDNCFAMLRDIYQSGNMHFLMGNEAAMLVWQKVTENEVEIVALHSLPETMGTGLCAAMMKYALEQIRQLCGEVTVFLWAFKENARARRFYEKHGFSWDGNERVSEFDGAVEVRYERKSCLI